MNPRPRNAWRRAAAMAAALALALGGVQGAGPALAAEGQPADASPAAAPAPTTVEELYRRYVETVDPAEVARLQAVMQRADGFVIRTGSAADGGPARPATLSVAPHRKISPAQFAARYPDVSIRHARGPARTSAGTSMQGGMGYGSETAPGRFAVCSLGFSAFNAAGAPAAISAGHCTQDGAISTVRVEKRRASEGFAGLGAVLGTFGFSRFGGPGNSAVRTGSVGLTGSIGTDVSVLDRINPALTSLPSVTTWKNGSPQAAGPRITGVARARIGDKVCKSGRTTGWTCGTVDEVGIFVVGGFRKRAGDLRAVRGFGMANPYFSKADEGDSGGAAVAGNRAVGITSAISYDDRGRAYFADLQRALDATPGYSLRISLNSPKLVPPAPKAVIDAGSRIHGSIAGAPAGTRIKVISGGKTIATVTPKNGKFSFTAPAAAGGFTFGVRAVNGYSSSGTGKGTYTLVVPRPVIGSPGSGRTIATPVTRISGTGLPGAGITLGGNARGTTVVAADGRWTIAIPALPRGKLKVTAVQHLGKASSAPASASFTVGPPAARGTR